MDYDLNIQTYWQLLKRRKNVLLLTMLCMGLLTTGLAIVKRPAPNFESSATLKIEKSSTTTGIYLEALSWSDADYLETQASIITSYPILEKVAIDLKLLDKGLNPTVLRTDHKYIAIVLGLQAKIRAEREGNSNLITITAQDHDPLFVQKLANSLARVYTDEHTAEVNKRTFDARKFIEDQLQRVAERLQTAEEKLRDFQEKNQVVSMDNQTNALLQKLALAETELLSLNKQDQELRRALDLFANISSRLTASFFISDAPKLYSALNSKLVNLQMQRQGLLLTFTEEHPNVQEIDGKIIEIQRAMQAALTKQQQTIAKRLDINRRLVDDYHQRLADFPKKGLVLDRLRREVGLNEKIYSLLETKLQEARIMEAAKIEEVLIVKPALEPMAPIYRTNIAAKGLAGMAVGLILGLLAAILLETLDTSITSAEQIENFTNLDVFATVAPYDSREIADAARKIRKDNQLSRSFVRRIAHLVTHFLPESRVAESYREIMTALRFTNLDKKLKVIAFTSATANEGKTTAILNTAIALAQAHCRVMIIEADMRQPIIARWLGIDHVPGLTDVLLGSYDPQQAIRTVTDLILGEMEVEEVTFSPGLDNMFVLPCGTRPANPSELLFSSAFQDMVRDYATKYDMILIDLPPVLIGADTAIIGSQVDGVVLVYRAGKTERHLLQRSIDYLRQAKANTLGIIMNGTAVPGKTTTKRYTTDTFTADTPLQKRLTSFKNKLAQRKRLQVSRWVIIGIGSLLLTVAFYWSYHNGGWL